MSFNNVIGKDADTLFPETREHELVSKSGNVFNFGEFKYNVEGIADVISMGENIKVKIVASNPIQIIFEDDVDTASKDFEFDRYNKVGLANTWTPTDGVYYLKNFFVKNNKYYFEFIELVGNTGNLDNVFMVEVPESFSSPLNYVKTSTPTNYPEPLNFKVYDVKATFLFNVYSLDIFVEEISNSYTISNYATLNEGNLREYSIYPPPPNTKPVTSSSTSAGPTTPSSSAMKIKFYIFFISFIISIILIVVNECIPFRTRE